MSNQPSPVPRDDAAILALNTGNNTSAGDETDSEDPLGKGGLASKIGQVDMFRSRQAKKVGHATHSGNRGPAADRFQMTPGAHSCPEIGTGETPLKGA